MENKPFFSVVIPMYNAEKYIERCVISVLNQNYKNIEVICVDDFSNDSSANIVKNRFKDDTRFHLIKNKKNEGPLISRLVGAANGIGTHFIFIDSDDWFTQNVFSRFAKELEKQDIDILQFGYIEQPGGKRIPPPELTSPSNFTTALLAKDKYISPQLWNKVYSAPCITRIVHNLPPIKASIAEDLYFSVAAGVFAKSIKTIHYFPYNYYSIEAGVSTTKSNDLSYLKKILNSYEVVATSIREFLTTYSPEHLPEPGVIEARFFKDFIDNRISSTINARDLYKILQSVLQSPFGETAFIEYFLDIKEKSHSYEKLIIQKIPFARRVFRILKALIRSVKE